MPRSKVEADGMTLELRGNRCLLRPWQEDDLDSLVRHADNPTVARGLYDIFPNPYTRADGERWISESLAGSADPLRLAIEVDGEACGGIGLRIPVGFNQDCLEVGYWLGEAQWGRGIATEAVRLVVDFGFKYLHANRIEARVYGWNPASARVLEKCGFRLEGRLRRRMLKQGERTDQLIYGLLPEDNLHE